jgi:hypothetical protein
MSEIYQTHIETEFRRYWPNATKVDARYDPDDEVWTVCLDFEANSPSIMYQMQVTSDDSWYTFTEQTGFSHENVITIPFPMED